MPRICFIELFSDIYQNSRFADFLIENGGRKVAIEIDDEASHNPKLVSQNKFYDDLLKQNSMIYLGWDVYRWAVRQMQQQPETVKDELRVFLGQHPSFKEIEDYLPTQQGQVPGRLPAGAEGSTRKQALAALEEMRCNFETIALLYHATGTGKTVTAVMDAKAVSASARCSWPTRWNWWIRPPKPSGSCGPGPRWAAMWRA